MLRADRDELVLEVREEGDALDAVCSQRLLFENVKGKLVSTTGGWTLQST